MAEKQNERKRVVLFDDTEKVAQKYAACLRTLNFQVEDYYKADEFVRLVRENRITPPDMFVIDVVVDLNRFFPSEHSINGDIEGILIAQEIRQQEHLKRVPIILISGGPSPDTFSAASKAAHELSDKNVCDCIFVLKYKYPPHIFPKVVKNYFNKNQFPRSKLIRKFVFEVPLFPFARLEFESHQ